MQGGTEFDYETFLNHKAELVATFEVALMDAAEEFERRHGTVAKLDWFCSNADQYIEDTPQLVTPE